MLVDEGTPRSAIAALDRRLDVILLRLGFVVDATGPTELDDWLAGLADEEAAAEELAELDEAEEGGDAPGAPTTEGHGADSRARRRPPSPGGCSGSTCSRGSGS